MVTFDCLSVTKAKIFIFSDSLPSKKRSKECRRGPIKDYNWWGVTIRLINGLSFLRHLSLDIDIWAQFHQHSTGTFYASSLMPILLVHNVEQGRATIFVRGPHCAFFGASRARMHKSWVYFLGMHACKVGRYFVGETDWGLPAPKNDYWGICTSHHKVRVIDHRYSKNMNVRKNQKS